MTPPAFLDNLTPEYHHPASINIDAPWWVDNWGDHIDLKTFFLGPGYYAHFRTNTGSEITFCIRASLSKPTCGFNLLVCCVGLGCLVQRYTRIFHVLIYFTLFNSISSPFLSLCLLSINSSNGPNSDSWSQSIGVRLPPPHYDLYIDI